MTPEEAMAAKKLAEKKSGYKDPFTMFLSGHRKFERGVLPGRFGVEIELEGDDLGVNVPGWTLHNDGSLRGGVEFVLVQPEDKAVVHQRMVELQDALKRNKTQIRYSPRASTHIHVNMQRESMQTILYMVTLHALVDPLMCRLAGETRDGNLFCLPVVDSGNLADYVEHMTASIAGNQVTGFRQRGKYASCNTNTLNTFGSLEFRVFPPTSKPEDVDTWVLWLDRLLDRARAIKSEKELRAVIDLAVTNPGSIIQIFDRPSIPAVEAGHLIQLGAETAYELYRAIRSGKSEAGQMKLLGKVMWKP